MLPRIKKGLLFFLPLCCIIKRKHMDNYIVSARKYRPSTFRNVVGQRSLTTTLKNAIQNNKLAHAYLFCGPRGVGKTSCARIFAKTINCQNPTPEGEACNACESCRAFNEQRSFNIHELDAASNNSVDDIRSLIDQVRIPPQIGRYKVYIIDEVHMLSAAAFNAFLKTLEEPPHHALFILATTEKHKILPTILSRCQIYDFTRISIADMVEHLQYVASSEGASADADALNVIAQKADGGMRDALSIFDQVMSFTGGHITYQAVIDNLNVLDYEYYFRLTDAFLAGKVRDAFLILNEILNKGFDGQNIITGLAGHFRDLLVCRDEQTLVLFEVGASIRARYIETAKRCPDSLLFKAIELANQADLNYRVSRNKRLLLELTLIQLCQLSSQPVGGEDKKKGLIEPVAVPPVQQTASSSSFPIPAAPSAGPVKTVSVPPSSHEVPLKQVKLPDTSINGQGKRPAPKIASALKDLGKVKDVTKNVQENMPVQEIVTPFTQDDLLRFWDAFAENTGEKVHLRNTMINCKPVLQEDFHFEVAVHNPGQQEEILNNAMDILGFLSRNLRNSRIRLRTRISEANEKHLAYTTVEKYNLLLDINPAISKLKDEFDLRID